MTHIKLSYLGNLIVKASHENGSQIKFDAPKDIGGEGKEFSPTDLLGASLASCMMITMAKQAQKLGIELSGMTAEVEKKMASLPVRRVEKLKIVLRSSQTLKEEVRAKLESAASHCPVHASLHPEIVLEIGFIWGI